MKITRTIWVNSLRYNALIGPWFEQPAAKRNLGDNWRGNLIE